MLVYLSEKLISVIAPISEFLFSFVDVIIMYFFFSYISGRKKHSFTTHIISILAATILLTGFALYNSFSSPNMIIRTITAFIFGMVLFEGLVSKKAFYIIIYSVVTIFVDLFLFYVIQLAFGIQNTVNLVLNPASIDRIIFKCLTKVIFVFILYFIAKRKVTKIQIPFRYFAFIVGIYFLSAAALLFLFEICLHTDINFQKVTLAAISTTSICIMVSDIFVFAVFELLCQYFVDRQKTALVEHQKNLTEKYILENEKNYKEIRKLWHDLDNHLSIIQAYLNEKENAKAISYIGEVQTTFQNVPMIIKTGNEIIDIVINQKRAIALEKNINFNVAAHAEENLKISSSELCVLLSNLLDNAIEASEKVSDKSKRKINLTIKAHKQFLLIETENYADIEPISTNGILLTRKKNTLNHGLGVFSMESIVKKYGGSIEHKYSDNIFRLTMMLNI